MTVQELIDALQRLPPDINVLTEGCDCYGDAKAVEILEFDAPTNGAGDIIGPAVRTALICR